MLMDQIPQGPLRCNTTPAQIRVDPTTAERAHRHSISVHLPNCDEMEMAVRCDLAALRDTAGAAAPRAEPAASVILAEVSRYAGAAVYASLPTSRLLRLVAALKLTMMAAQDLDQASRNG
jgi:hypothetical protein